MKIEYLIERLLVISQNLQVSLSLYLIKLKIWSGFSNLQNIHQDCLNPKYLPERPVNELDSESVTFHKSLNGLNSRMFSSHKT